MMFITRAAARVAAVLFLFILDMVDPALLFADENMEAMRAFQKNKLPSQNEINASYTQFTLVIGISGFSVYIIYRVIQLLLHLRGRPGWIL